MAHEPRSVSKMDLEEMNDSIISLFECPVCYGHMFPPIYQCKNAHNICASCRNKLKKCPSCRETFLSSRNFFVEEIALTLFYPCENADVGCTEKKAPSEIEDHHKVCPYRLYECLIGKASNCPWKGRRFEIAGHVGEAHATNAWMSSHNSIIYDSDIFQGNEDSQLISALNEIFWYHFKYDVRKQKLFIALQFVGPKEQASSFTYTVIISSSDEEVGITIRNRAGTDIVSVSEIYESGNCVTMTFDMLKRFLHSSNSFPFVLIVEKALDAH